MNYIKTIKMSFLYNIGAWWQQKLVLYTNFLTLPRLLSKKREKNDLRIADYLEISFHFNITACYFHLILLYSYFSK